ncbi:hypothetical protein RB195_017413 [Necator americanus]|uniref:Uncharacterized protein n=1 Tax=Necator americanus TaxID=51031 RepID=A0ABR1C654_NECAM
MLPCFPSRAPMVLLRFKALYQPNAFWYAGSASFAFLQYTYHCTSGVCNVYLAGYSDLRAISSFNECTNNVALRCTLPFVGSTTNQLSFDAILWDVH